MLFFNLGPKRVPYIHDKIGVLPKVSLISGRTHLPSKLVAGWLVAAIQHSLGAHSRYDGGMMNSAKPIVGGCW